MSLTMAELGAFAGMAAAPAPFLVQRRVPGWVEIGDPSAPGAARWVRESAYRGMRQRQAGTAWWGDPSTGKPGIGRDSPFDPNLNRKVRNIREWQRLEAWKKSKGVPPGVKSKEDWKKAAQESWKPRSAKRRPWQDRLRAKREAASKEKTKRLREKQARARERAKRKAADLKARGAPRQPKQYQHSWGQQTWWKGAGVVDPLKDLQQRNVAYRQAAVRGTGPVAAAPWAFSVGALSGLG